MVINKPCLGGAFCFGRHGQAAKSFRTIKKPC